MARRTLLFLALLLCTASSVWANGETLYVRPIGACANNGDGTTHGCAASAGAAGAYIGFTNVLTNASNTVGQVDPGDTLYVCGAHTEVFAVPSRNGTSPLHIVLDGRCPTDAGSITVGDSAVAAIYQAGSSNYWDFQYLTLSGGTVGVIYCNTACDHDTYTYNTMTCTHIEIGITMGMRMRNLRNSTVGHNTITGAGGSPSWACSVGILVDTTGVTNPAYCCNVIEYNAISHFPGAGIRFAGANNTTGISSGPNTIRYNTTFDNGDGIYHVNSDNTTNTGNISYNNLRRTQGGEGYGFASLWSENTIYEDGEAYGNNNRGIELFSGTDPGVGTRDHLHGIIRRNYVHGNNVGAFDFNAAILVNNGPSHIAAAWDLVEVYANVTVGSTSGFMSDDGATVSLYNNTFINPTREACIFLLDNADNITAKNNLCVPGTTVGYLGDNIYGIQNSNGAGVSNSFSHTLIDNTTATVFARVSSTNYTAGTISTVDSTAILANPLLDATYHTLPGSPARRVGVTVSPCTDFTGTACDSPPTIGAYQVGGVVGFQGRAALLQPRNPLVLQRCLRNGSPCVPGASVGGYVLNEGGGKITLENGTGFILKE